MNMINIDDTIAKQQIIALLDDKVMSQQDVTKYLDVSPQTLANTLKANILEPLYVFKGSKYVLN